MELQLDAAAQEARVCATHDACRQCHSGLITQPVLCLNGEVSALAGSGRRHVPISWAAAAV